MFVAGIFVVSQNCQFFDHGFRSVGQKWINLSQNVHQLNHAFEILVRLLCLVQFLFFRFNLVSEGFYQVCGAFVYAPVDGVRPYIATIYYHDDLQQTKMSK